MACYPDDFRPAMAHIYCHKGGLVASNGHILVKFPLSVSGFQEHAEKLEGYAIHPAQYREILKYNVLKFENPGEIKAYKTAGSTGFWTVFKLKPMAEIEKRGFPDYEKILDFEQSEVDEIGLNQFTLKNLIKCFQGFPGVGNWRFKFQAKNKGIHLEPESEELEGVFGLIMPVMIHDKKL